MENEIQTNIPPVQPMPPAPASTSTQSSTNWYMILFFTILVLIIVAGSVVVGMQIGKNQATVQQPILLQPTASPTRTIPNPTSLPTADSTTNPTATWKTINGKHWTFNVPKEWYFIKCLSGDDIILGPNLSTEFRDVESECNFGIRDVLSVSRINGAFTLPSTTSPDQSGIYTIVSNKKSIIVDTRSAIQQTEEYHGNPMEGTHTAIYVPGKNYTDSLTFWDTNKNFKTELIDQILATFRFTN